MGIVKQRLASSLVMVVQGTLISGHAIARECWSAIGATATEDEQNSSFILRGPLPGPPVLTADPAPAETLGPAVAVGQTFGLSDHMVSLKRSAPPGTYTVRYSAVPTSYFDAGPNHLMSAIIFVQDLKKDRVVVQLKEIRYESSARPIDPKPKVTTVAVLDSAFDPLDFQANVPTGRFVVLRIPFSLKVHRQVDVDTPPFLGREHVHYYVEAILITNREPSGERVTAPGILASGQIRGPALALVSLCPDMDMGTCFFEHSNLEGARLCLRGNEKIPALDASMDNKISSFFIAKGGVVLVCDEPNFDFPGWCETFTGTVKSLSSDRNDKISSIMRIR